MPLKHSLTTEVCAPYTRNTILATIQGLCHLVILYKSLGQGECLAITWGWQDDTSVAYGVVYREGKEEGYC